MSSYDQYSNDPYNDPYDDPTPAPKKSSGLPGWAWALIIVFVIGPIGLVGLSVTAAIAIPSLMAARFEANEQKIEADLRSFTRAIEAYHEIHGTYPHRLAELAEPDDSGMVFVGNGTLPTDPFGRPYLYAAPGVMGPQPCVYTLGNDQVPGGELVDADYDNLAMYR